MTKDMLQARRVAARTKAAMYLADLRPRDVLLLLAAATGAGRRPLDRRGGDDAMVRIVKIGADPVFLLGLGLRPGYLAGSLAFCLDAGSNSNYR
jgi:hypothetical protein